MGSPFATTSDPIPIPWDPPHTITVRKLTGREHERAQDTHREGLALGRANVWSAFLRRALEKGASDPEVLKAVQDPLTGYDRYVLATCGLVAWSYSEAIPPSPKEGDSDAKAAAATAARLAFVDRLVDEMVDFTAREVLRQTKPALFLTTDQEVDEAQKELPAAASVA